jgi:NAD(P)-dependent dehydrogenase (short-subunit alcohol dehydrogenase family)
MSSDLGSVTRTTDGYIPLYRASKAALNSLIRSFAAELGGRRVTVLAIHPGWVRTDMGGDHAPVGIAESVKGVVDVLESRAGTLRHGFLDYNGRELAW